MPYKRNTLQGLATEAAHERDESSHSILSVAGSLRV